jgi:hypothetical protein
VPALQSAGDRHPLTASSSCVLWSTSAIDGDGWITTPALPIAGVSSGQAEAASQSSRGEDVGDTKPSCTCTTGNRAGATAIVGRRGEDIRQRDRSLSRWPSKGRVPTDCGEATPYGASGTTARDPPLAHRHSVYIIVGLSVTFGEKLFLWARGPHVCIYLSVARAYLR